MTDYVLYEHRNNPAIRYYVHPEDDERMGLIAVGLLRQCYVHPEDDERMGLIAVGLSRQWGEVRIRCPRNAAFDTEDAPEYRMAVGGVMPAERFWQLYRPVRDG